ncbi:MAG: cation diffusion facilitator family transporter [Planctomycetota bacterium]
MNHGAIGPRRGVSPTELVDQRIRWRAGLVSLVVAVALLLAKYQAWRMTGSTAVLSDALESIVNVIAAAFGLGGLLFAGIPADRNHPYGHGKIEFIAAAFEGGLIAFAALLIVWEAIAAMISGPSVRELDAGILIVAGAGVANGALGWFLVRTGRRYRSLTLVADGQHVLSDFWTSVGIVIGLVLVKLTGEVWLDPVCAIVVAGWLLWTGVGLVRTAAGGLLDEEDPELLHQVTDLLGNRLGQGVIRVHHLRAIRAGRTPHISAHLVVPEFWTVEKAHDLAEHLAARVQKELGDGELTFHTDPCHRAYCAMCDVEACSVRVRAFNGRPALTIEEAVQPDRQRLE